MDPRRPLDETKLAELADQVWQHGLCNPYWFVLCRKAKLDRDRSGVLRFKAGEERDHSGMRPRTHRHGMRKL